MSAKRKRLKRRKDQRDMKKVLERSNLILDIILESKYDTLEDLITTITDFRNESNRFITTL